MSKTTYIRVDYSAVPDTDFSICMPLGTKVFDALSGEKLLICALVPLSSGNPTTELRKFHACGGVWGDKITLTTGYELKHLGVFFSTSGIWHLFMEVKKE